MKISAYKKYILQQLSPYSDTPQLDAELLLMHVLKKTRTELLIHSDDLLSESDQHNLNNLITRRISGEPIAYLLGHQPFWTMDLMVTKDTLIPRPETECLIDWILKTFSEKETLQCADLGTGTGAIAIALAREKSNWTIDATDLSHNALFIAKKNAAKYDVRTISFYEGNWCDALTSKKYDLIVSNPPYISENDFHLDALKYEPPSALISGKDGLDAIKIIVHQVTNYLKPNGYLIIEHGYDQADLVSEIFHKAGLVNIESHQDLSNTPRFTTGIKI